MRVSRWPTYQTTFLSLSLSLSLSLFPPPPLSPSLFFLSYHPSISLFLCYIAHLNVSIFFIVHVYPTVLYTIAKKLVCIAFFLYAGLKKWVEVGNSGVFRPEMLLPMGLPEDVSVIAWGLSLERSVHTWGADP